MKRVLYFLSGTVCLLIAVAFILLFSGTFGSTASSYITTANQYGKVQTTVPAILNGEVNISFHNGSLPETTEYDITNTVYVESSYSSSSSSRHYAMKIDDVGLVSGSTNVYGLTDYYDTPITDKSLDPLDFVDFFGVVKSSEDYGTVTNTTTGETYTMPLVTENSVGDTPDGSGDGYTTLNITPFKERVQVTVYFTMRQTDNSGNARNNPYYAFYFNGEEIYYNNETTTGSTGVKKSTYNNTNACYELDDYTFTAGDDTSSNKSISTHQLYSYTTVLDAETATNIMTGTDNQTMIFLIVLEPYNPLTVTDNNGNISGTVAGNGTQTLNVSYDASKADTPTATVTENTVTSSDTSVATASISQVTADKEYTVSITPVGVGETTITVCIINSASEEYSKEYTLTVENALMLQSSYTVSAKDSTCTIAPSFAFTVSGDVSYAVSSGDENVATVSVSDGTITVTGVSPGSADITVTATVNGIDYKSTTTVYVNGYVIKAADGTTTVKIGNTLTLGLYKVESGVTSDNAVESGVTWSVKNIDSTDETVCAKISNEGVLTGEAKGTVTVTAKLNEIEYTYTVIVKADETVISFTSGTDTYYTNYNTGDTTVVTVSGATTRKDDNETVEYDGITYTTSIKMESSTNITISNSSTVNVTLYFYIGGVGNKVKINDVSYEIGSDGTVTVEQVNEDIVITKDSTNTYLFLVVIENTT